MHDTIRHLFALLLQAGVVGTIVLGILDSTFLFLPFGNDLLVVLLTARNHQRLILYALSAALGSTTGVWLLDKLSRPAGDKGLRKTMKRSRFAYLRNEVKEHSAAAILLACLAPPPFPFTIVVVAASSFQYPREKLLTLVFIGRAVRFCLIGLLAVWMGDQILAMARSPGFTRFMIVFIAICGVGSAIQIVRWVRRSR